MRNDKTDSRSVAYMGIFVALLIGGGLGIYQISYAIAMPGMKYVLMAPFIALMLYLLQIKVELKQTILKFSLVFGMIMVMINLYMGMAIALTGVLTEIVSLPIKRQYKKKVSSALYAGFVPMLALGLSKYVIGGVVKDMSFGWIMIFAVVGFAFGWTGVVAGQRLERYLKF